MKTANLKKLFSWRREQGVKAAKRIRTIRRVSKNPGRRVTILIEPE